jgi:hypothetical protein
VRGSIAGAPPLLLGGRMEDRQWVIITLDDEGRIQELFMDSWMQVVVVPREGASLFITTDDRPEARSV